MLRFEKLKIVEILKAGRRRQKTVIERVVASSQAWINEEGGKIATDRQTGHRTPKRTSFFKGFAPYIGHGKDTMIDAVITLIAWKHWRPCR